MSDPGRSDALALPDDDEIIYSLYGCAEGHWMLLKSPLGLIVPPSLTSFRRPHTYELTYLGEPSGVVIRIYEGLAHEFAEGRTGNAAGGRHKGPQIQQAIADMLGVSQQSISRYIEGGRLPRLTSAGWSNLVKALYATAELAERS